MPMCFCPSGEQNKVGGKNHMSLLISFQIWMYIIAQSVPSWSYTIYLCHRCQPAGFWSLGQMLDKGWCWGKSGFPPTLVCFFCILCYPKRLASKSWSVISLRRQARGGNLGSPLSLREARKVNQSDVQLEVSLLKNNKKNITYTQSTWGNTQIN